MPVPPIIRQEADDPISKRRRRQEAPEGP
jgi:hypothetical protein